MALLPYTSLLTLTIFVNVNYMLNKEKEHVFILLHCSNKRFLKKLLNMSEDTIFIPGNMFLLSLYLFHYKILINIIWDQRCIFYNKHSCQLFYRDIIITIELLHDHI